MSLITNDVAGVCYWCGKVGPTDVHHMMHGNANRRIADREDLTVHLCRYCHDMVHNGPLDYDTPLKQEAQRTYEKYHSRGEWMRIFGKNYLDLE